MKPFVRTGLGVSRVLFIVLATCGQTQSVPAVSQAANQTGTALFPALETIQPIPESLEDKKPTRSYVIRVIDAASRSPVSKASVAVELTDDPKAKWEGHTDSKGIFTFTWELNTHFVKAHIVVQAPGFWTMDDYNVLVEERIIQLNKVD